MKEDVLERAIIVGVVTPHVSRWQIEEYLNELELLADTAGAEVLERIIQVRERMDPAFMIGRGKVAELAQMVKYLDADLVIFDDDLSAAQVNNIEQACRCKIIDRSGLILDIFAKHARSREAKTQVELAQLKYLLPRLTGQWRHLSRQVGGIGVRGPGETQLEMDRRLIRNRITRLEKELAAIARQRQIRRKQRQNCFKVALVGYTNVGKSTLLNALTTAQAVVEDRLFATLDATVRRLRFNEQWHVLLIDTVGFIRKLPHHLVASFKSTLEETADADLLLHVIDITHPNYLEQIKTVEAVLAELGLKDKPVINVFNKIDQMDNAALPISLAGSETPTVYISAQKAINLDQLTELIYQYAIQKKTTMASSFATSGDKMK